MIGIPDHQAVIGRLGAKNGPSAFRRAFSRLKGRTPLDNILFDLGDIAGLGPNIEINHRLASDKIQALHLEYGFSIVVGGGHDHGFSQIAGIYEALRTKKRPPRLGCINIDAHLDLRAPSPNITSGSPFYLAIENKILNPKYFVEFGIQSHCNALELWKYAEKKKVRVIPFSSLRNGQAVEIFKKELRRLSGLCDTLIVSLDLDAAASAFSPGVSAPQAEGFTSSEIIQMAEISGLEKKCVSLGIFELNPEHDIGDRSTNLAATSAFHCIEQRLKI